MIQLPFGQEKNLAYCVKFISSGNLLWLRLAGKPVSRREAMGSNLPCNGKGRG